jgi:hypothetical protein
VPSDGRSALSTLAQQCAHVCQRAEVAELVGVDNGAHGLDDPVGHAHTIAHEISTGGAPQAIATAPAPLRGMVAATARSALVQGLNTIMLIAAIVSFAAAAVSFVLIRERDFVTAEESEEQPELAVAA